MFWNYFLGDFNYHQCIKINNRISGQMAWLVLLFQKSRFENTPYLSSMGILRVKMKLSVYSASHSQSKFHLHWHWGQKHSFKGGKTLPSSPLEGATTEPLGPGGRTTADTDFRTPWAQDSSSSEPHKNWFLFIKQNIELQSQVRYAMVYPQVCHWFVDFCLHWKRKTNKQKKTEKNNLQKNHT